LTGRDDSWPEPTSAAVSALAPQAVDAFRRMIAAVVATRSQTLELVRLRVAMLLQLPADVLPSIVVLDDSRTTQIASWPTAAVYSAEERASLSFAEQFVMDVASVMDADRAELTDALGAETFGFVQALYVLDHSARLSHMLRQLFGVSPLAAVSTAASGEVLWPATEAMMTAVAGLAAVDPLTAELVRLRGARLHRCRLCCSRRRVSAVAENSGLLEATDIDPATLSSTQRAALELADAMLLRPGVPLGDVARDVQSTLTPREAIEVALLVSHNAANKIAVALGADAPVVADGVEYFEVEAGEYRYGLVAPT
jgi:alkylhydroperoxidase family enzyme